MLLVYINTFLSKKTFADHSHSVIIKSIKFDLVHNKLWGIHARHVIGKCCPPGREPGQYCLEDRILRQFSSRYTTDVFPEKRELLIQLSSRIEVGVVRTMLKTVSDSLRDSTSGNLFWFSTKMIIATIQSLSSRLKLNSAVFDIFPINGCEENRFVHFLTVWISKEHKLIRFKFNIDRLILFPTLLSYTYSNSKWIKSTIKCVTLHGWLLVALSNNTFSKVFGHHDSRQLLYQLWNVSFGHHELSQSL